MTQAVKITWLGHATFLLTTAQGKKILVDPWLGSNPACPKEFHDLEVDAILITHGHGDHIGDVFTAHERCAGPIVGIFDLTSWLATKGVPQDKLVGMNKGGTVALAQLGLKVSMTHAIHSSGFQDGDQFVYLGEAAGYVLRFDDGPSIYIAGDTCLFGDMKLIGQLYAPDLAILPIGDHFTMDPQQAALAAQFLGVKQVIPAHWGTFGLLTGSPEQLEQELGKLDYKAEVIALKPGQST